LKVKNKKRYIFFLILFLISLCVVNFNLFGDYPDEIVNSQIKDEEIHSELKTSFIEDWNHTWHEYDVQDGHGIAIDEITRDIYVTGYNGSTSATDVILIKYNNNGEQQWNVTWDNGDNEYGKDVAIDSQGDIYVTGVNGTSTYDLLLLKFNKSGDFKWKRTWDGGIKNEGCGITIDSNDNIYITGFNSTGGVYDMVLLKYNKTGHLQWTSVFNGPDNQFGRDIVLDSNNNVYVVGSDGINPDFNLLLVKFDNLGNQLWNRTWGGIDSDQGSAAAVDSKNNVYITGFTNSYGAVQKDIVLVKYDTNGNWQWNQTWGTTGADESNGIAVDSADNIYLGGHTQESNVTILKYSSSGDLISNKTWERDPTYQYWCKDLIIDSLDKIYITGYYRILSTDPHYIYVAKFSIESPGGFTLTSVAGEPDDDGNFLLSWTPSPRANNYSIYRYSSYITEYNSSLTLIEEETSTFFLPLTGYSDGTYYFIGVAFNDFGNSTSNCINVTVDIPLPGPPGTFILSSDAGSPDVDGNFTLIRTSSSEANNYSIYQYSSYITEINGSLTLLEEETSAFLLPLTGYSSGTYYFIGVAFNDFGNSTSNCINVTVAIPPPPPGPPGAFTLSSNAGNPDDDGNFTLTWTSSSEANNYSIYQYSSDITEINGSLTLLIEETNSLSLSLSGYSDGTYYFVGVAFNDLGNSTSNCILITVDIPPGEPIPPIISGYNLMILCLTIGLVSVILVNKRLKLK